MSTISIGPLGPLTNPQDHKKKKKKIRKQKRKIASHHTIAYLH